MPVENHPVKPLLADVDKESDPKNTLTELKTKSKSSVYGPVHSWRVGQSLGIDLLLESSICSFNCIYCQLGDIQNKTLERKVYVKTDRVLEDLKQSAWQQSNVITLSGSGEPTLALNLAEVTLKIKAYTKKPVMVLTNGTTLNDPAVRAALLHADIVAIKLDAGTDEALQIMNRPVPGVTLASIVEGAVKFRSQFCGTLYLQCMFMPANLSEARAIAALGHQIQPNAIQLNTPKRIYPKSWFLQSRGGHGQVDYPGQTLRTVSSEEAAAIEEIFQSVSPALPRVSIYRDGHPESK